MKYFFLVIISFNLYAQTGTISGTIVNSDNHEPLDQVSVIIKNFNLSVFSDSSGRFILKNLPLNQNYLITFSRLSFKSVERSVYLTNNVDLLIHLFELPFETNTIIISGEHSDSHLDNYYDENVLKGKELQRVLGMSLAGSLSSEMGISVRSMGPAPARPVIRGLSGDRIVLNEDGNNTNDLSSSSPDHAVAIESFTADRIEVVRGPKVLLNTSSTIGGVVNVIRNEIPDAMLTKPSGSIGILGESVNKGYLLSGFVQAPLGSFVVRGEVNKKQASNINTPAGRLNNSEIVNFNFNTGVSYIFNNGFIGAAYKEFNSDYGIPGGFVGAHPFGVDISMFKRQINIKSKYELHDKFIEDINFDFSRTYYNHNEYESSGSIGAKFALTGYNTKLLFNHNNISLINNGIFGIEFDYRDFSSGGFVNTPKSISYKASIFLFEQKSIEDFDFQFSARYNFDKVTPFKNYTSKIGYIEEKHYSTYSLSASMLYKFSDYFFSGVNISRSSRVPTIEELYSEGPHLAAYSYEVGNPYLKDEKGIGTELFVFYKADNFSAVINMFRNDLYYYIIPRNTGRINSQTLLPVYASSGEKVYMQGIEFETELSLFYKFSIRGQLQYTEGILKVNSKPLPQIPPFKGLMEIKYVRDNASWGFVADFAASQNKVDIFELPTNGYLIFNTYAQYQFILLNTISSITLNIDNITNKEYRNHLSRVKIIMPEAGRNFKIIYRVFL